MVFIVWQGKQLWRLDIGKIVSHEELGEKPACFIAKLNFYTTTYSNLLFKTHLSSNDPLLLQYRELVLGTRRMTWSSTQCFIVPCFTYFGFLTGTLKCWAFACSIILLVSDGCLFRIYFEKICVFFEKIEHYKCVIVKNGNPWTYGWEYSWNPPSSG